MDDEKDQQVSIDITKKLGLVKVESEKPSDPCIRRVPKHLRDVKAKAYEPQIIAIGPYHRRNKPHLQLMEKHKLLYLKTLLKRGGEQDVTRYVKAMREFEVQARACYIDAVCLKENGFVEMLLLDACFIVELFRNFYWRRIVEDTETKYYDPVFDSCWMEKKLCRDLLLAENQIPFFVLDTFFHMTAPQKERNYFLAMIFSFFDYLLHNHFYDKDASNDLETAETEHLLSLVHDRWFRRVVPEFPISRPRKWKICERFCFLRKEDVSDEQEKTDWNSIRCATELQEAGIKFEMPEEKDLFEIKFEKGTIKIPKLTIEDDTESFMRNLILYEQLNPKESNLVVDYICFMDRLINSAKDVGLLCQSKIIDNLLGDDEVVAKMFNRLGDSVILSGDSKYKEIYVKVKKHCGRRRNKWMANLKHNYFNTPWALISVLAAVLLLLLTLGQTVFSVLAYYK